MQSPARTFFSRFFPSRFARESGTGTRERERCYKLTFPKNSVLIPYRSTYIYKTGFYSSFSQISKLNTRMHAGVFFPDFKFEHIHFVLQEELLYHSTIYLYQKCSKHQRILSLSGNYQVCVFLYTNSYKEFEKINKFFEPIQCCNKRVISF